MTKKDFELVAAAVRKEVYQGGVSFGIRAVVSNLCANFSHANPRFNREKFIAACGIEASLVEN